MKRSQGVWMMAASLLLTALWLPAGEDRDLERPSIPWKSTAEAPKGADRQAPLEKKLAKLVIPNLVLEEVTIAEVLTQVKKQAKEVDPEGVGFNLFIRASKEHLAVTVTLDLRDVPVREILYYIQRSTDVGFLFEEHAVVVVDNVKERK